jgi:hypothetical protein
MQDETHPRAKQIFRVEDGRFCWGFCENADVGDGFLMVKVWCLGGELWVVDGGIFALKNLPCF